MKVELAPMTLCDAISFFPRNTLKGPRIIGSLFGDRTKSFAAIAEFISIVVGPRNEKYDANTRS